MAKQSKEQTAEQIKAKQAREQSEARRKAAREYVDADVSARTYTGGNADMHGFVDSLLVQAADLDDERVKLLERIDANRQILRNLVTTEAASDEQRATVEGFYPTRQKGESVNGNESGS